MNENEYQEILQVMSNIDPILERWAQRYTPREWMDYHERLRIAVCDQLKTTLIAIAELQEYIY